MRLDYLYECKECHALVEDIIFLGGDLWVCKDCVSFGVKTGTDDE